MCADYRLLQGLNSMVKVFSELGVPLGFEGGLPNIEPRADIRITDRAPVVVDDGAGGGRMEIRPWSWKGPNGAPVFNFRSEGRRFAQGRCLILADGFYEFTGATTSKTKWLFTVPGAPLFALAGYVKDGAFTMLTCAPGADIAPYHSRQAVVLRPEQWADWLSHAPNEAQLLTPLPAGGLAVEQVGGSEKAPGLWD
jgi:putative SOS response-associated peptidase YedK